MRTAVSEVILQKIRIVVTGAAGRIGREIIEDLPGLHELVLIDSKPVAEDDSDSSQGPERCRTKELRRAQ